MPCPSASLQGLAADAALRIFVLERIPTVCVRGDRSLLWVTPSQGTLESRFIGSAAWHSPHVPPRHAHSVS